jgi:flagellar protein FlaJ
MFKLPYSLMPTKNLRRLSYSFIGVGEFLQNFFPFLKISLRQAEIDMSEKEYLSMCFLASTMFFLFFGFLLIFVLAVAGVENFLPFALIASLLMTLFAFLQQIAYPKIFVNRRVRGIERNLMAALQNILVQLNSGVPLFDILVNLSRGNYGEISKEFSKAVKQIHSGNSQVKTLEEMAATNPSLFFRRAIWQLVNGMKSGADMSRVINEIINLLSEEQILQIQRYGSQLNPLAMFYMLLVVIMPSLGTTFLIILSSFISIPELISKMIFWGVYAIIIFFQIMFMGVIKSKRPNLLGE